MVGGCHEADSVWTGARRADGPNVVSGALSNRDRALSRPSAGRGPPNDRFGSPRQLWQSSASRSRDSHTAGSRRDVWTRGPRRRRQNVKQSKRRTRRGSGYAWGRRNIGLQGGAFGLGTVYKLTPSGTETVLHSFAGGSDGATPFGGVILDSKGNLYGTTTDGGSSSAGIVFKVSASGTETVLYTFAGGPDGANPTAGLVRDQAGNLFGTTAIRYLVAGFIVSELRIAKKLTHINHFGVSFGLNARLCFRSRWIPRPS